MQYDTSLFPKATNRRSFIESPADIYGNESSWPLTSTSTATSYTSNGVQWTSLEKSLPPTPRSRGVSLSRRGTEDYTHQRPTFEHRMSEPPLVRSVSRPASWNPRCTDIPADFDLNLDRAILGTSLARDHRLKREETVEEQQNAALESILNTLKISSDPLPRHYSWTHTPSSEDQLPRKEVSLPQHVPATATAAPSAMTDAQRQRQVMNRIVSERNLNPNQFDTNPKHARFFVIKSYNVRPPLHAATFEMQG